jgi:transposase InsO family protein
VSKGTGKRYPLTMICEAWRVARSTVYAARHGSGGTGLKPQKRGPKTVLSDEELLVEIREVLKTSKFLGEGHRKVTYRLRGKGIRVGRKRVLRLMRENGLLAPVRFRHDQAPLEPPRFFFGFRNLRLRLGQLPSGSGPTQGGRYKPSTKGGRLEIDERNPELIQCDWKRACRGSCTARSSVFVQRGFSFWTDLRIAVAGSGGRA